jgi:hypothetical protein
MLSLFIVNLFLLLVNLLGDNDLLVDKSVKASCEKKETGFVRLKSHVICIDSYDKEEKNIYQVHFTAGQHYKLNLCDANKEGEKLLVYLLDKDDRELASNYIGINAVSNQLYFDCKQSGTYYFHFCFQNKAKGCGIATLLLETKRSANN